MEMEMGMDSLSFHPNPPPPPSSGGQEAFSLSYCYCPPYAAGMTNNNPKAAPPRLSCQTKRAAVARKDQHSKICTAGGMRDRRMRLSMDVARRFFYLQDKLGFDKASKTVQWLLDKSTAGISHLLATSTTSVSMSEEDGSGSVLLDAVTNSCKKQQMPSKGRRRAGRKSSNGGPVLLHDKESRARARQRARERTMERNRLRSSSAAPASRQVILPAIPNSFGSYCEEQEPWELAEVVFAQPRLHH